MSISNSITNSIPQMDISEEVTMNYLNVTLILCKKETHVSIPFYACHNILFDKKLFYPIAIQYSDKEKIELIKQKLEYNSHNKNISNIICDTLNQFHHAEFINAMYKKLCEPVNMTFNIEAYRKFFEKIQVSVSFQSIECIVIMSDHGKSKIRIIKENAAEWLDETIASYNYCDKPIWIKIILS